MSREMTAASALVLAVALVTFAACDDRGASEPELAEATAAGIVREKLGGENQGSTVHCEVLDFEQETLVWSVRCSLTNAQGKKWSDWSVNDRTSEIHQLPGGEAGFPTNAEIEEGLSEGAATGLVREKVELENTGSTVQCEVVDFETESKLWVVRCSVVSAEGRKWSQWSVNDHDGEVLELPGGGPGFPTDEPN